MEGSINLGGDKMANGVKIGKYTLESLTTGMYSDPKIIFREYIQNAVDSLDEAQKLGIEDPSNSRINILIDKESKRITIHDNGTGIKAPQAFKVLTDIGNSKKRHTHNRGFRGIGRLGGFSYCKTLTFTTSFKGEAAKTIVSFDCNHLKEVLIPGEYDDYDLQQVIDDITTSRRERELSSEHYFIVEMKGVDNVELLDIDRIESYVRQVAPLPYGKDFSYSLSLKRALKKSKISLGEFSIYLGGSHEELHPAFKPNKTRFFADVTKNIKDEISELNVFEIKDDNEQLIAIGWYGDCSWYGSITDKEISGLRVRKGNILIGDAKTLSPIFKEERFNGWTQGEVFVISDKLIPNARRDDFEQNEEYYYFIEKLTQGIGSDISKKIRKTSRERNNSVANKVKEAKRVLKWVENINKQGFNSEIEKKQIKDDIKDEISNIEKIKISTQEEQKVKEKAIEELEKALVKTEQSENFKVAKVKRIGEKELYVLKVVSNVLTKNLTKENVDMILGEIIRELNGRRGRT